jgi:hypothetical protein
MKNLNSSAELKNRNLGKVTSTVVHIILVVLLFLNFFTYPDPPPGQEGFTVVGSVDVASSNEQEVNETNPKKEIEEVVPKEIKPVIKPKETTKKTVDREVKKDPTSEEIALAKKIKEQKDEERKEQLLEEARIQAEQDRIDKQNEAINKNKQLFDNSKNGKPGDSETEGENPNSGNLEKLGDGMSLGGGLGDRGVVNSATFDPAEQVKGKVTIDVCVDANGNVLTAKRTLKNTTITSQAVIEQAVKFAKKWKFEKGKKACGTITYVIKLK